MRPSRQYLCFVLLICLAAAALSAQEERTLVALRTGEPDGGGAESALSHGEFTFRKTVEEVEVRFVATDPAGRPARNLQPKDVNIIADGKYSPEIKSLRVRDATPIEVGIVIDLSESIRPEMHLEVVAFSNELRDILRPGRDREFVIAFSNKVTLLQPPTSDFSRVQALLERHGGDHNLTSLFDAVVSTCRDQFGIVKSGNKERRVVLLFTDGVDNLSIHSMEEAIDAAVRSGVTIYAVAPRSAPAEGRQVLRRLAEGTGGSLELIQRSKKPELTLASLGAFSGEEYAVTFRPPDLHPGFHSVQLRGTGSAPLLLHSPPGYFLTTRP